MITFSTKQEVNDGVERGVKLVIDRWASNITTAESQLSRLQYFVGRMLEKVQEDYPEAKCNFDYNDEAGDWEVDFYSNAKSSSLINALVRPSVLEAREEGIRFLVINQPLSVAEMGS